MSKQGKSNAKGFLMSLPFSGFPLAPESELAFSGTDIPGKALFSVLCWTPEHRCPICVSLVHQPLWGFRPLHQAIITWRRPIPSPAGLGAALLRPGLSLLSALSSQLDSSISRKYQIWLLFKLSQRYFYLIWQCLSKGRLRFPRSSHETAELRCLTEFDEFRSSFASSLGWSCPSLPASSVVDASLSQAQWLFNYLYKVEQLWGEQERVEEPDFSLGLRALAWDVNRQFASLPRFYPLPNVYSGWWASFCFFKGVADLPHHRN